MNKSILCYALIVAAISIIFLLYYLDYSPTKEEDTCHAICVKTSKQLNMSLFQIYTTNNSGKLDGGCRCEFSNGQIVGFGINKSMK